MTSRSSAEGEDRVFPLFSTVDRGTRMTHLLPGRPVGRLAGPLLAQALLCAAAWAVAASPLCAAYLELAPKRVGSPWAAAASLVIAYVALGLTLGLSGRAFMSLGQARLGWLLGSAAFAGGFAVSAWGWLAAGYVVDPEPGFDLDNIATSPTLPRELLALAGGAAVLWLLLAVVRLGSALAHARSRQETIERLRREGIRYAGELAELNFRGAWLGSDPIFEVVVAYTAGPENRVVTAHMRTSQDRVPAAGTSMVVLVDGAGSVHVELDRSAGVEFEENDGRYAPSEG